MTSKEKKNALATNAPSSADIRKKLRADYSTLFVRVKTINVDWLKEQAQKASTETKTISMAEFTDSLLDAARLK